MRRAPQGLFARRSWICVQCRAHSVAAARSPNLSASKKNNGKLPDTPARTRFAPSPTGYLHLGSLRTALFNYLLARKTGGQFLLRIEDTDQKRTIPGAEERLCEDLNWAGLQWDEGPTVGGPYGPYRQSERTSLYRTHAHELISNGHAYRCFCSPERLDTLARHRSQAGLPPGYDRTCADLSAEESEERASKGETHVVRLKADGYPMFEDLVYGKTGQNRQKHKVDFIDRIYDDPILLKSDGHPTYHLANVVDDHTMKITHVIRGTEWMPSTPMHIALYDAFKWSPPKFGHVPLLVDKSGQKLSKRNADIDISFFRDKQGVLPATLVNFAALLGWSHTQKSDVFSLDELEQIFNLKITKGNTVVAFEKLWFLQKAHAQRYATTGGPVFEDMVSKVAEAANNAYPITELGSILQGRTIPEYVAPLLRADAKSYTNAQDFVERNRSFFTPTLDRTPYTPASSKNASDSETPTVPISALHTAAAAFSLVPEFHWSAEAQRFNISSYDGASALSDTTSSTSATEEAPPEEAEKARIAADKTFKKELYHYLRWALSGGAPGPGIPETMEILGRAESVKRLEEARRLTTDENSKRGLFRGNRRPKDVDLDGDNSWMGSLAPR
ncbi:Glutamate--tRNA ligase mitochondrial [Paecilomyces lecythidis]|uniref:glutamate--tRNA ligase n=1 Tax=Paecilomyces lecythidis TaxID=3004212 RepID=A0ABR3YFX9_9EURO